jgi:type IV pilus assembly protein PilO
MRRDFQKQKNLSYVLVASLLLADAVMAFYYFNMAASDRPAHQELQAQTTEIRLLQADVARARAIQQAMPSTKADCERFKQSLPSARTGFSVITSELGELGHKAGLQITSLDFHSADIRARDLTEVAVNASVSGNYKSIMNFVNGLQRSKNYYIVESLTLGQDTGPAGASGIVKVDLHLKSYFKGAA